MYQPRRLLSQMHILSYTRFMRERQLKKRQRPIGNGRPALLESATAVVLSFRGF